MKSLGYFILIGTLVLVFGYLLIGQKRNPDNVTDMLDGASNLFNKMWFALVNPRG